MPSSVGANLNLPQNNSSPAPVPNLQQSVPSNPAPPVVPPVAIPPACSPVDEEIRAEVRTASASSVGLSSTPPPCADSPILINFSPEARVEPQANNMAANNNSPNINNNFVNTNNASVNNNNNSDRVSVDPLRALRDELLVADAAGNAFRASEPRTQSQIDFVAQMLNTNPSYIVQAPRNALRTVPDSLRTQRTAPGESPLAEVRTQSQAVRQPAVSFQETSADYINSHVNNSRAPLSPQAQANSLNNNNASRSETRRYQGGQRVENFRDAPPPSQRDFRMTIDPNDDDSNDSLSPNLSPNSRRLNAELRAQRRGSNVNEMRQEMQRLRNEIEALRAQPTSRAQNSPVVDPRPQAAAPVTDNFNNQNVGRDQVPWQQTQQQQSQYSVHPQIQTAPPVQPLPGNIPVMPHQMPNFNTTFPGHYQQQFAPASYISPVPMQPYAFGPSSIPYYAPNAQQPSVSPNIFNYTNVHAPVAGNVLTPTQILLSPSAGTPLANMQRTINMHDAPAAYAQTAGFAAATQPAQPNQQLQQGGMLSRMGLPNMWPEFDPALVTWDDFLVEFRIRASMDDITDNKQLAMCLRSLFEGQCTYSRA